MQRVIKHNQIRLLWLILFGLLVIGGCKQNADNAAKETEFAVKNPYYKGPLKLEVAVSSEQINLSDLVVLELSATVKPGYEIDFPAMSDVLKQFKIRSSDDPGSKLGEDGKILKERRYQLEPLEVGRCEIPALTFEYHEKATEGTEPEVSTLKTEPVWVVVTTTLTSDSQDVGISDIEDVVDVEENLTFLWIGIAAVVLVLVVIVIVIAVRPKRPVQIKRVYKLAHQIAFEMLNAISDEKLVEQGLIKEFYERLSTCLRQYIENRFALRAPEQTTEEFLAQLRNSDALELDYKEELRKFLEHCDLVKFARYEPTNEQINESLTMAERFVVKTMSDQCQVDVTEENTNEMEGHSQ